MLLKSLWLTRVTVCLIQLACLGVAEDTFYRTANSGRFDNRQWKKWISQRAFVALYVASHRGHSEAVQYLLEHGKSHRGWVCSRGWCSVTKSCLTAASWTAGCQASLSFTISQSQLKLMSIEGLSWRLRR